MKESPGRYEQRHFCTEPVENDFSTKLYWPEHQILLVGDGDFSFSLSLAVSFGSASNIVATSYDSSYDSYDVVIRKYNRGEMNLDRLRELGATLLFGIDAKTMKSHVDLSIREFDRIVYNFPHAGFLGDESDPEVIKSHQDLVYSFFKNASEMLQPYGEVHVTHKTTFPFNLWKIQKLAYHNGLTMIQCAEFKIEDYPGYNNKRGDGSKSDDPFPLGECSTFRFMLSAPKKSIAGNHQEPPDVVLQRPNTNLFMNSAPLIDDNGEGFRNFVINHARYSFWQTDCNPLGAVPNHLRFAFQRYKAEDRRRRLNGYANILGEVRGYGGSYCCNWKPITDCRKRSTTFGFFGLASYGLAYLTF